MTENERMSISGLLDVLNTGIAFSTCHMEYAIQCNVLEDLIGCIEELEQYREIGTVEEFKDLKEKNEPKKIDIWANGEEHCPFCDKNLTTFYGFANCFSCGQKLDWQ